MGDDYRAWVTWNWSKLKGLLKNLKRHRMEGHAYQEERSNHEGEKLSVIPFANTVVKPLQIKIE